MQDSEAFWKLSSKARDLYLLFLRNYNGHNANKLVVSYLSAKKVTGMSRSTFDRSMKQLIEYGFIEKVKSGGLNLGSALNPSVYKFSTRYKEKSRYWWHWQNNKPLKVFKANVSSNRSRD